MINPMRNLKENEHYELFWEYKGCTGTGYSFECDRNGVVNVEALVGNAKRFFTSLIKGRDPMPTIRSLKRPQIIIVKPAH